MGTKHFSRCLCLAALLAFLAELPGRPELKLLIQGKYCQRHCRFRGDSMVALQQLKGTARCSPFLNFPEKSQVSHWWPRQNNHPHLLEDTFSHVSLSCLGSFLLASVVFIVSWWNLIPNCLVFIMSWWNAIFNSIYCVLMERYFLTVFIVSWWKGIFNSIVFGLGWN